MHGGRVRLRPILRTTFALIAGMMPVAIGMGEGGEFYRPMAVAIIGGTITSTVLTLLVIPSFYDSIELNKDRAKLKFKARTVLYNPVLAFLVTFGEFWLTITFIRFIYRGARFIFGRQSPSEHPAEKAARLHDFVLPEGWDPRPKAWQGRGDRQALRSSGRNPHAARPTDRVGNTSKTAEPPLGAG
jgi:hypothetical protein